MSKPCPLSHGHTLTLGTTTFTLHIDTEWETYEQYDFVLVINEEGRGVGGGGGGEGESLDLQRRRELNKIMKRYGLQAKDTYNEEEVKLEEAYNDRAFKRRVGSEPPEYYHPDNPSASVHRQLSDQNRGHQMLVKMGWQKGQGLGEDNMGVAKPVRTGQG